MNILMGMCRESIPSAVSKNKNEKGMNESYM
jgi:hypothetical protein